MCIIVVMQDHNGCATVMSKRGWEWPPVTTTSPPPEVITPHTHHSHSHLHHSTNHTSYYNVPTYWFYPFTGPSAKSGKF